MTNTTLSLQIFLELSGTFFDLMPQQHCIILYFYELSYIEAWWWMHAPMNRVIIGSNNDCNFLFSVKALLKTGQIYCQCCFRSKGWCNLQKYDNFKWRNGFKNVLCKIMGIFASLHQTSGIITFNTLFKLVGYQTNWTKLQTVKTE